MSERGRIGNLVIVSGPSGAGKSALVSGVLRRVPQLGFSVSYTTRAPRGSEQNGVEYFFVNRSQFEELIHADQLLEWAEVHGNYYGTSSGFVGGLLRSGKDVLLDIDVQGAKIIRRQQKDAIGIFVLPPSYAVLRDRIRKRSLDEGIVIEQRLQRACEEIRHYPEYDYLIVNRDLDSSVHELESIILGARCRMAARIECAKSVVSTFGGKDAEDP